jgi:glyoxylase-like metal-dependent hydrolase (beta-lactamase superfamily II)
MNDTADVEPKICYVLAPGHTPGHHAVHIESGGARLLHIVDTLHTSIQLNAWDVATLNAQSNIALASSVCCRRGPNLRTCYR